MNTYGLLQQARNKLLAMPLKKSGKNKFAGYEYFELGDFLPEINMIFNEIGLCGVVSFTADEATLTIHDTNSDNTPIVFRTPLIYASNPKGQAIQDLGSTHTYLRRYLWLMAMEIVEHDAVDAMPQAEVYKSPPKPPKEEKPTVARPDTKPIIDPNHDMFVEKMIEWGLTCETVPELMEHWKANQSRIDEIKAVNPALADHLKNCFAEMKQNIGE
jgi:hypothetical protein